MKRPYETDNSRLPEIPKNEKTPAQTDSKVQDNNDAIRYIGKNKVFLYESPTMASNIVRTGHLGEEVEFLGEKKKSNGFEWAKVNYKGKIGWVKADFLNLKRSASFIDKNVPEGMIVNQSMGSEDRTKYLNEKIPKWMTEKGDYPAKEDMIEWYKDNGANVRYTGTYCLPIKTNAARISQGFYGTNSHAGKYNSKDKEYVYESGWLGAVDIAAEKGTPVYSVLGGKVVYTYEQAPQSKNFDMHRVTVETKINGEIYYIEYLHMDEVKVEVGQTLLAGTPIGTVGGWGSDSANAFSHHLDFRVYQFKEGYNNTFNMESSKQFLDPFEFFDFDIQYKPKQGIIDYN